MLELTDITKSYNNSGVFLQNFVLNSVRSRNWQVDVEYPVVVAPFLNNPRFLTHYWGGSPNKPTPENFVTAIQNSQNSFERSERSIDVVARRPLDENRVLNLCIECKKLNPKFTEWCFFQQKRDFLHKHVITKSIIESGNILLFQIPGTTLYDNDIYLSINLNYNQLSLFDKIIVDYGLALSSEKIHGEFFKTEQTVIDQACRQIIEGLYGYTIDKLMSQILHGESNEYGTTDIFVPLVITNTKLKLCKFDEKTVDPNSGQLTAEPEYEEVDSLFYEYNSPKTVQYPEPLYSHLPLEHRRSTTKWYVLILSPKGFVDFLNKTTQLYGDSRWRDGIK